MRTTDVFGVLRGRYLGQADADPAYTSLPVFPAAPAVAPPTGVWRSTDARGNKTVVIRSSSSHGGIGQACEIVPSYEDWVSQGRPMTCGAGGPPQGGAPPPSPAPVPAPAPAPSPASAPIPGAPPSGCNIPPGYGPMADGSAPPGKAVFASLQPDGTYNVINQSDNSPVMSQVSQACLAGFASVNLLPPGDPRAGGAPTVTNPGAQPLTYPIQNMWFPGALEAPPIQPVGGTPAPTAAAAPYPSAAPPAPAAPPLYAPGQPIPVTDWFGICVQKARKI